MRSLWLLLVLTVVPGIFLVSTVFNGCVATNQVSTTAWYCTDAGGGKPRQLEPGVGLHVCTNGELHDAGYWSGVL